MVTYGDWRQDPDYVVQNDITPGRTNRSLSFEGYGLGHSDDAVVTIAPADWYTVTADDLREVVAQSFASHSNEIRTTTGTMYGWGRNLSYPEKTADWGAGVARPRFGIRPADGGREYVPWGDLLDPNAIGVEFQGTTWNPDDPWASGPALEVGATIAPTTRMLTYVHDSTSASGGLSTGYDTTIHLAAGEVTSVVASIPGHTQGTAPNHHEEQLGFAVDLTDPLSASGWVGEVWTETTTFVPPADLSQAAGRVEYGWALDNFQLQWLLRPTVYRFVYGGLLPIRRTFPRDDGRAGGAPRTYPPSKALQSGIRTTGGYL